MSAPQRNSTPEPHRVPWRGGLRAAGAAALVLLVAACTAVPPPPPQAHAGPLYCYQSIADVTCYARPDPRDRARLVGYLGPPPEADPRRR